MSGLRVRVIPCLDVDAGRVVKGVNFTDLRDAGDPVEMARVYDAEGADELIFLDITASSGDRETTYDVVRRTAEQVFIPLTVGGGVRTADDVDRLLRAGADKVGVNTAAIARPELIGEIAAAVRLAGAGAVGRRAAQRRSQPSGLRGDHPRRPAAAPASTRSSGRRRRRRLGAGEILLNSMDADGTKAGFDLELIARGAGRRSTCRWSRAAAPARSSTSRRRSTAGADAVLAASVFHFGQLRIGEVKAGLRSAGAHRPLIAVV